jgi:hypothetical protein
MCGREADQEAGNKSEQVRTEVGVFPRRAGVRKQRDAGDDGRKTAA